MEHRRALATAFTIAAVSGAGTFAALALAQKPALEAVPAAVEPTQPPKITQVRTRYVDVWVPVIEYLPTGASPAALPSATPRPTPSASAAPTPRPTPAAPTATATTPPPGLPPLATATPTGAPTSVTPTATPTPEEEDHDD